MWLSSFGDDLEALSGWATKEQAEAALGRYIAALRKGPRRLLEEVERGPSGVGYVDPGDLSADERDALMPIIAQKIAS